MLAAGLLRKLCSFYDSEWFCAYRFGPLKTQRTNWPYSYSDSDNPPMRTVCSEMAVETEVMRFHFSTQQDYLDLTTPSFVYLLKCNSSNERTADLNSKCYPHVGSVPMQKFRRDRDLTKLDSNTFQFSGEKNLSHYPVSYGFTAKGLPIWRIFPYAQVSAH